MTEVYQLWCEYDIGQEGIVFKSPAHAIEWANVHTEKCGLEDYDTLRKEMLIGVEPLEVIGD